MRSAYAAAIGGDDPVSNLVVGERPDPEPADGEVRVRVSLASLNHHDLWTLKGIASHPVIPPQALGCDAVGVVESYGGEVPEGAPAVGSRVVVHSVLGCGECDACRRGKTHLCPRVGILSEPGYPGALAELLVVPVENLVPLPDSVSFESAVCLPTAYVTAYHALFARAHLSAGDTLLVHGVSGGVATAALLLARQVGATPLATSRSDEKAKAAIDSGLVEAVYKTDRESVRAVLQSTGRGVDVILDSVGEATWDFSLRVVAAGGTIAVVGTTSGANPLAQLNRIFWRHITVAGSSMGTKDELAILTAMVASGRLEPLIDEVFDLADTGNALRQLAEGRTLGKLLVRVA